MIGNWQWFWFLLATVKCTWSLNQSEYGFYWGLLDDPYGNTFSTDGLMHRRELSLQMTQTHKFGLPKCTKQQNECRNIGIVGAGKFSSDHISQQHIILFKNSCAQITAILK